jgi:hypothetical protein
MNPGTWINVFGMNVLSYIIHVDAAFEVRDEVFTRVRSREAYVLTNHARSTHGDIERVDLVVESTHALEH